MDTDSMNKTIVIYHKSDFDGIFCREIARKFLPDAELIGWEYGEPAPEVSPLAKLYILDLSVDALMGHSNLVWIDHHKTAIDKYPASIAGYRIDGVAACRLAWQWFTQTPYWCAGTMKAAYVERNVSEPLAVRLAGEYDIWDKRDPDAELFQHGLRSQDLGENMWELLLAEPHAEEGGQRGIGEITVETLLDAGEVLQYAKAKENESVIGKNGFTIQWEGLTLLACNASQYNSHLFTAGIRPEHEGLLGFCLRSNMKWTVSLYGVPGKPDVDLSAIATRHGGGGHKQACGFTCDYLPFGLMHVQKEGAPGV